MSEPDMSPIDQQWVATYCDQFTAVARQLPAGPMREEVTRRVACCLDLLEAWQKRNWPKGWRE